MKKMVVILTLFILVLGFCGGVVFAAEETKVPLKAVKPSCYGEIDLSKTEFSLSDVGRECIIESWLEKHQPKEGKKPSDSEGLPEGTAFHRLDNLWTLGSGNCGYSELKSFLRENHINFLGGKMSYAYKKLDQHVKDIEKSNLVLLFNPSAESYGVLKYWPQEYSSFFPFQLEKIVSYQPPYIWFKRSAKGYLRGVLVAGSENVLANTLKGIFDEKIPIGVPVSYEDGSFHQKPKPLEGKNFKVAYPIGHKEDAQRMLKWAKKVEEEVKQLFPQVFQTIDSVITISLYPRSRRKCSRAGANYDPPKLNFALYTPCYKYNHYYDREYYIGNLAHTLGYIIYNSYRQENAGVSLWESDVPDWFVKGFCEYLKMISIGKEEFRKYAHDGKEAQNIVENGFDDRKEIYAAGSWALRFLDQRFGPDTINSIVKSSKKDFWEGFNEQTGLSKRKFANELEDWLEEEIL